MTRAVLCLLILTLFAPRLVQAANIKLAVTGIGGEAKANVEAWLSRLPETEAERLNFVASARSRVGDALRAVGYYNPDIDIEVDRSARVWRLRVEIDPGAPVRIRESEVSVTGDAAGDPAFAQLTETSELKPGEILHHGRYERLKQALLSQGQRQGYFDASLRRSQVLVDARSGVADIALHWDSGPRYRFGELVSSGAEVDAGLLAALAEFEPGQAYDRQLLQRLLGLLLRTGYFSGSLVQPLPARAADGEVPVLVELEPASRHSFDVGVGYSTDTEER
ncbi:MAG: POTRA domain-containing protein, partial [Halioglobus sp.]|nr:POTRA domain-containing protein [Halioglobus sp.]